jgi:hypothetical protein
VDRLRIHAAGLSERRAAKFGFALLLDPIAASMSEQLGNLNSCDWDIESMENFTSCVDISGDFHFFGTVSEAVDTAAENPVPNQISYFHFSCHSTRRGDGCGRIAPVAIRCAAK